MYQVKPRSSNCLISTMRELGLPSGLTVATLMAFGSITWALTASANHFWNWAMGSASTSVSLRLDCT